MRFLPMVFGLLATFAFSSAKAQSYFENSEHYGLPWVKNVSRPNEISNGLENRHISIWASHGRYFAPAQGTWKWQRVNLFGTNEDLFTQTFVVPYIIPMLENAGAVVFSPRERDWQIVEKIIDNDTPTSGYEEKGKWKNVVVPQDYIKAVNSPNYERFKLLYKRSLSSLYKAINGSRTEIDLENAGILISEQLDLFAKVQNIVLNSVKEIDTPYMTELSSNLKSSDTEKNNNAWNVVNDLTHKYIYEISKDYRIVNDLETTKKRK